MLVSTALDPDMIQALEDTDGEHSVQTTLVLSQRKAFSKKMENACMHAYLYDSKNFCNMQRKTECSDLEISHFYSAFQHI